MNSNTQSVKATFQIIPLWPQACQHPRGGGMHNAQSVNNPSTLMTLGGISLGYQPWLTPQHSQPKAT